MEYFPFDGAPFRDPELAWGGFINKSQGRSFKPTDAGSSPICSRVYSTKK